MANTHTTLASLFTDTANAIRSKTGGTAKIVADNFPSEIAKIEVKPPTQEKTVTAGTSAVAVTPDSGKLLTKVTVNPTPSQSKSATPSTSAQTISPDAGKLLSSVTVNAMASGALSDISVSSSGLITGQVGTSGYLASGTKKTKQLTTKAATTITPSTSNQTAVASGVYTTGAITVAGDADLIASNIREGVDIFGVVGTLKEGVSGIDMGEITPSSETTSLSLPTTLTATPTAFLIYTKTTRANDYKMGFFFVGNHDFSTGYAIYGAYCGTSAMRTSKAIGNYVSYSNGTLAISGAPNPFQNGLTYVWVAVA